MAQHRRPGDDFVHVGSIDLDLAVDPAKADQAKYATIVQLLQERGYRPAPDRRDDPIPYSFERTVSSPADHKTYAIRVDFLTHVQDLRPGQHRHLVVQNDLLARKAKGCEAAFRYQTTLELSGCLPEGGEITVPIQMANLTGCLTMKGLVLGERFREKDAYDLYALLAHYKQGPSDSATELKPHLADPLVKEAVASIHTAFAMREPTVQPGSPRSSRPPPRLSATGSSPTPSWWSTNSMGCCLHQ